MSTLDALCLVTEPIPYRYTEDRPEISDTLATINGSPGKMGIR